MMKFYTKIFLLFISVSFSLFANSSFAEKSIQSVSESFFAPDVAFFNEEGGRVFLDQFEGKTILLSFWASWCGHCVEDLPSLDSLQKDFRKLPFEVIAVSEDFNGIKAAKDHFTKYGIRHLALYHDYKNALFKAMSVVGLPTSFLIDPEGRVKLIIKGNVKWYEESVRSILLNEIPGNPEAPKNSYITTSLNKKVNNAEPIKDKKDLQKDKN